jgi:hypothetical protein
MKINQSLIVLGLMITVLTTSCNKNIIDGRPPASSNKVILEWNEAAFEAMGGVSYQHSLLAARVNAMVHLAMHDALNAIKPTYEQYAYKKTVGSADAVTAAAKAAHTVLTASFPGKKSMLDSMLSKSLANVPEGTAKYKGIEVGTEAGNAMLAARAGDGGDADPIALIPPSTVPGVYNVVPPFNFVFAPHWKTMRLFGLERHDQFRSVPPPALSSTTYKVGFNEVKDVGVKNSKTRTADQTAFAKYWYEFSEIGWNRVARTVAANRNLGLMETARLFALLDMAVADSYTAGWDSKFHYNFWRPYTAIRAAANDLNDETLPDNTWESLEVAPPVQDYPSTHSALGNAAAKVLAAVFGNATPFTMTSFTAVPAGYSRSFTSFSQAADENAASRVMAGIHFRFSCEAGQKLGDDVGNYMVQKYLKPIN